MRVQSFLSRLARVAVLMASVLMQGCVSYSSAEGKMEVGDIQYRQGSCRSALVNYLHSANQSINEANFGVLVSVMDRIKSAAPSCVYGNGQMDGFSGFEYYAAMTASRMDAVDQFSGLAYEFAVWLADDAQFRIVEDKDALFTNTLAQIAKKHNDAVLEKKALQLRDPQTWARNARSTDSNVASGRALEQTHDESMQAIQSLGSVLSGVAVGAAAARQSQGPNSGAKSCGRRDSAAAAIKACQCEGGRPERIESADRTSVQCKFSSSMKGNWGCAYFKDGSPPSCAVR